MSDTVLIHVEDWILRVDSVELNICWWQNQLWLVEESNGLQYILKPSTTFQPVRWKWKKWWVLLNFNEPLRRKDLRKALRTRELESLEQYG